MLLCYRLGFQIITSKRWNRTNTNIYFSTIQTSKRTKASLSPIYHTHYSHSKKRTKHHTTQRAKITVFRGQLMFIIFFLSFSQTAEGKTDATIIWQTWWLLAFELLKSIEWGGGGEIKSLLFFASGSSNHLPVAKGKSLLLEQQKWQSKMEKYRMMQRKNNSAYAMMLE